MTIRSDALREFEGAVCASSLSTSFLKSRTFLKAGVGFKFNTVWLLILRSELFSSLSLVLDTPCFDFLFLCVAKYVRYVVATFTPRSSHISNARFTHSLLLAVILAAGGRSESRRTPQDDGRTALGNLHKSLFIKCIE